MRGKIENGGLGHLARLRTLISRLIGFKPARTPSDGPDYCMDGSFFPSLLRPGPHCGWLGQLPDAAQCTAHNAYECIPNLLCKTAPMVYRGAMRIKCLAQEHTTENSSEAGLEPPTY